MPQSEMQRKERQLGYGSGGYSAQQHDVPYRELLPSSAPPYSTSPAAVGLGAGWGTVVGQHGGGGGGGGGGEPVSPVVCHDSAGA